MSQRPFCLNDLNAILAQANQRQQALALPYAGALTPIEAWALWQARPLEVQLIDVRTSAELEFVGRIEQARHIAWKTYPGMQSNPEFLIQLHAQVEPTQTVLFICRTGGRSHEAAAAAANAGYAYSYNVLEGFEGRQNSLQQRGQVDGWQAAGLPWIQN